MPHLLRHLVNGFKASGFLGNATFHHSHNLIAVDFNKLFANSVAHMINHNGQTMGATRWFIDIMQQPRLRTMKGVKL